MARTLFDCVGDWFEDIIQAQLPDLKKVNDESGTRPDFTCEMFDAEAKTGYWDYGAQLKEAQVRNFKSNGKPIVYIIGYHSAQGLRTATERMTAEEIDIFLKKKAGIHSGYVVSNSVIKKIWARENHTAVSNPEWKYFSVRPRHLDAIITNRAFERGHVRHMPSRWYRLSRADLLLQPAPLLYGRKTNLRFGAILDKKTDSEVIDYMQFHQLI